MKTISEVGCATFQNAWREPRRSPDTSMKKCAECRLDEREDEGRYCTDCRMEKEIEGVRELLKMFYPKAEDWNCVEKSPKHYAEILDKRGKRIAWISERALTDLYNRVEVL